MSDIEAIMAAELAKSHTETQQLIETAHKAVKAATESAVYTGELIDKVREHKRSTIYQWLSEHAGIDGTASRAYALAKDTNEKRMAHSDRRLLLRLGILEQQVSTTKTAKVKRPPASLQTKIQRANRVILSHIEKRPVSVMTEGERLMLKHNLEALAKLYVEASSIS